MPFSKKSVAGWISEVGVGQVKDSLWKYVGCHVSEHVKVNVNLLMWNVLEMYGCDA